MPGVTWYLSLFRAKLPIEPFKNHPLSVTLKLLHSADAGLKCLTGGIIRCAGNQIRVDWLYLNTGSPALGTLLINTSMHLTLDSWH
jgi:hypothetical protein